MRRVRFFSISMVFILFSCKPYYVLKKSTAKQKGYMIFTNDHTFFLPCKKMDTTLNGLFAYHKRYGIRLYADYPGDEMDVVKKKGISVPVSIFFDNGQKDTIIIASAYAEYHLIKRMPKSLHDGGNFNFRFFFENKMINILYYDAIYEITHIKSNAYNRSLQPTRMEEQ